jgi:hypothetical protein
MTNAISDFSFTVVPNPAVTRPTPTSTPASRLASRLTKALARALNRAGWVPATARIAAQANRAYCKIVNDRGQARFKKAGSRWCYRTQAIVDAIGHDPRSHRMIDAWARSKCRYFEW